MEKVIEVLLIILISALIVSDFWGMQLLIKKEIRGELLDILMTLKLKRELDIETEEDMDKAFNELEGK